MLRPAIFLPLALLLFSACNHYYYAPNSLHQPLLLERNDASVRAAVGLGTGQFAAEVLAAYSPVKHLAVQYNYFSIVSRNANNTFGNAIEISGRLHEGALGTYWSLSDAAHFSLYGGFGRGRAFNSYEQEGVTSELRFDRWFAQPGIIVYDDRLRFNLGVRFSHLAYTDGYYDLRLDGPELDNVLNIQAESPYFLIETGIGFSLHLRPVVLSLNFVNSQTRKKDFAYKRGHSNLGLALDLHDLYKKRKKEHG